VVSGGDGTHFQVARFTAAGALDTSFFSGGLINNDTLVGQAQAVAVVPVGAPGAGDIVAVGYVTATPSPTTPALCTPPLPTPAVVEYKTDGSLNTDFPTLGAGGVATLPCPPQGGRFNGVAVDSAGNIYAAGESFDASNTPSLLIAEFSADGTNNWGKSYLTGGSQSMADSVAVVPSSPGAPLSGDVITAGSSVVNGIEKLTVAAFSPATMGEPDPTFNTSGWATAPTVNSTAAGVTVLPSGNIVAVGSGGSQFLVAQFGTNGALTGFGGSGLIANSPSLNAADTFTAVSYQPLGNVLVAAGFVNSGANTKVVVAQYNPTTGALNKAFGTAGAATQAFAFSSAASAVTVDTSGRTIAAGSAPVINAVPGIAVLRLLGPTVSVPNPPCLTAAGCSAGKRLRLVAGIKPIMLSFSVNIDEALYGPLTATVCAQVVGLRSLPCQSVPIPAGATAVSVIPTVPVLVAVGRTETVRLTVQPSAGMVVSGTQPFGVILVKRVA
jgi:uncharacterized delta-60 repeat protein